MKPSPTELIILKHLWAHGDASMRELHDGVSQSLEWSRSSTRKTVERMIEKKMIGTREVHGLSVYSAKIKKIPTLAGIIQAFASDVLGLDGPLPVANLVQSQLLSPAELEELDNVLKKSGKKT